MTTLPSSSSYIRPLAKPEDISETAVMGVCASLKPAPGISGRSATRSILLYALNAVGAIYPEVFLLDLREHPPPLFDGRFPHERDDPGLRFALSCIDRAGALLLSVPAYWSGVSGVFKNFVDVLCGPAYEMDGAIDTVFAHKPVGLIVVGADDLSARTGAEQAQAIMLSAGARIIGQPLVVSNPRADKIEDETLARELVVLGAELARHAYVRPRTKA